ncbi:MAG: hypothetical protein DRN15_10650 [Thermoprotei archaeon]|nr:MAG: hypothetical protein DRN15_10650 [Thermoprotei archaeon]
MNRRLTIIIMLFFMLLLVSVVDYDVNYERSEKAYDKLLEEYPNSFVIWEVEEELLGSLRVLAM